MFRRAKYCLVLLVFLHTVSAQTDQTTLELNKPIERELTGGQTHAYSISLTIGQYARAVVIQRGIDVVVSFHGPDGQKIVELDTPSDDVGPEPVAVLAEINGAYVLEVSSTAGSTTKGRYELELKDLRTATAQDKSYLTAQKAFTEAKPLRNQRTRSSYRNAIEKYQEALTVWRAANEVQLKAYTLNEMGLIYGDIGEYQKGLDAYSEAHALYTSLGDWRSAEAMNINTAWIYGELGEHQKALALYLQVQETHRAKDRSYVDPILLSSIGATYAKARPVPNGTRHSQSSVNNATRQR